MSGTRRSTRATTSTINVKLNEKNEIEYFKVENDMEEDDDDIIGDPDHDALENDEIDDDAEEDEETADGLEDIDEEDEEEELIVNADGTMSIKIPEKKPKQKKVPMHHICAKCSRVLSSGAVSEYFDNDLVARDSRNFVIL